MAILEKSHLCRDISWQNLKFSLHFDEDNDNNDDVVDDDDYDDNDDGIGNPGQRQSV